MYDSKMYNYLTKSRIKCSNCNREFDITSSDLKRIESVRIEYTFECPRCCAKSTILYDNLPISLKDSI